MADITAIENGRVIYPPQLAERIDAVLDTIEAQLGQAGKALLYPISNITAPEQYPYQAASSEHVEAAGEVLLPAPTDEIPLPCVEVAAVSDGVTVVMPEGTLLFEEHSSYEMVRNECVVFFFSGSRWALN